MRKLRHVLSGLFCGFIFVNVHAAENFYFHVQQLPLATQILMQKYSWHADCPVQLSDLDLVQLNYYSFDGTIHNGELIVNQSVTQDLQTIFSQLFHDHFPIAKIRPIDDYQGDDLKAMADDDTYAFACRFVTGTTRLFSQHSYGTAIDINPLQNPYVKDQMVLPSGGNAYLNRLLVKKGMIIKGDFVYTRFKTMGWQWGGDWSTLKDYQHFQKS